MELKEKFIKNKNKILIILAFILSLSGVVVLAEVTSKDDNNTAQEQEARMLEASILKSKDNDTDNVTDNLSSIDSQEEVNQNNDITQEDTKLETSSEEAAEQVVISSEELEILAYEEALLIEKQIELDKAYQLEQAAINAKIVPNKYKEVSFNKIGTQSAADVQIGISTANNFVNIRELPSEEGKVLGKLYNNEAAAILSVENGWALIESGSVKGYVTTEYLNMDLTKDEVVESVGKLRATITVDGLNVRQEANEESKVLTVVYSNEKYTVSEVTDDWVKISIPKANTVGYVSIDYVELTVSFEQAISIEEEQEILRKQKEEEERKKAEEAAKKKAAQEEAKRKAAAKKKAEQEAAKKASSSSKSSTSSPASSSSNHSSAEQAAKEEIARRESGGNYNARNGKYIGRYQLNKSYLNGDYSPENQERVADNYVARRYGSWQNALKFWNANGWY